MRERVPSGGLPKPFIVPRLEKNTIRLNGDNASFADVIAPRNLIQCKHTSIAGKPGRLDLNNEL